ncbi:hypothetical protein EJ04DRAFT_569854 [Polyplosphaeria fusca]|uniref:Uncharacterized protein n=1 Tax=Polyplosphaeria fusca TaxID=682080 RepID=A0A9P4UXC0_9PLEO|nr:hypothetical protein EJ04DRAFT_569854 [Polyplosphaeria fusca]
MSVYTQDLYEQLIERLAGEQLLAEQQQADERRAQQQHPEKISVRSELADEAGGYDNLAPHFELQQHHAITTASAQSAQLEYLHTFRKSLRSLSNDTAKFQACRSKRDELLEQLSQLTSLSSCIEEVMEQECLTYMGKKNCWSSNGYKEEALWKRFISVAGLGTKLRKPSLAALTKVGAHWGKELVIHYRWPFTEVLKTWLSQEELVEDGTSFRYQAISSSDIPKGYAIDRYGLIVSIALVEQLQPVVSRNASSLALQRNTSDMPEGERETSGSPATAATGFDLQHIAITSKTKRARISAAGARAKKARTDSQLAHVDADVAYAQLSQGRIYDKLAKFPDHRSPPGEEIIGLLTCFFFAIGSPEAVTQLRQTCRLRRDGINDSNSNLFPRGETTSTVMEALDKVDGIFKTLSHEGSGYTTVAHNKSPDPKQWHFKNSIERRMALIILWKHCEENSKTDSAMDATGPLS